MSSARDGASVFTRALTAMGRAAGVEIAIDGVCSAPWTSALFIGEQVRLAIRGSEGDRLDRWCATLPDAEFALRRYIVADLAVERASSHTIEILALLIEDIESASFTDS